MRKFAAFGFCCILSLACYPEFVVATQADLNISGDNVNALFSASTHSGYKYVQIPPDVSRSDVANADQTLKDRLHEYAQTGFRENAIAADPHVDTIVVFIDSLGLPILPGLEKMPAIPANPAGSASTDCPTNELAFTFNSSTYPWTTNEQDVLRGWTNNFYPVIKSLGGNPFFNITVNVRKDPTLSSAGVYYASINEIAIPDTNSPDVFCHEMVHAFRDDYIMGLPSFEEGMARAVEVEVMNRFPAYPYWDRNHSYGIDQYYEGINRPEIGAQGGNFFSGYVAPMVRYQLAGYAWAKCYFENTNFFQQFNCKLYQQCVADPTTSYTEAKLVAIAATVLPTVEGKDFLTWYGSQGVLNTSPPKGYFLFQRFNLTWSVIDYFFRDSSGFETMQASAQIQWSVFDNRNSSLGGGSATTGGYGWVDATPLDLRTNSYAGRIRIVAQAGPTNSPVRDTALAGTGPFGSDLVGVYGSVGGCDAGNLTITPLSTTGAPVTLSISNGAFSVPNLLTNKGRFLADFRSPAGAHFTRQFNKDASSYYLELRPLLLSLKPSLQPGQLYLILSGELGHAYQIETSTNLTNWSLLYSATNQAGDMQFTVTNTFNLKAGFYRARGLP